MKLYKQVVDKEGTRQWHKWGFNTGWWLCSHPPFETDDLYHVSTHTSKFGSRVDIYAVKS